VNLLTKNASFEAEFRIERGLGYVPREALKKDRVEIGEISVNAIFSPIRRVNYEVENMRVGDRTDFNRLRIAIETDGTLTPRVALEQAIEVMITQLKAIVGFREEELPSASSPTPMPIVNGAAGARQTPKRLKHASKTSISQHAPFLLSRKQTSAQSEVWHARKKLTFWRSTVLDQNRSRRSSARSQTLELSSNSV
jgi:hypothetical protein